MVRMNVELLKRGRKSCYGYENCDNCGVKQSPRRDRKESGENKIERKRKIFDTHFFRLCYNRTVMSNHRRCKSGYVRSYAFLIFTRKNEVFYD